MSGHTTSYGNGLKDVYVVKVDEQGDTLWTKTIGGITDDFSTKIQNTSDNGYVIAGTSSSIGNGDNDIYLLKFPYESCCIGIRGNVDGDPLDQVDISDQVYIVDFIFTGGPPPPCMVEANADGDPLGAVDMSDLVYLVDFIWTGGPPPSSCP